MFGEYEYSPPSTFLDDAGTEVTVDMISAEFLFEWDLAWTLNFCTLECFNPFDTSEIVTFDRLSSTCGDTHILDSDYFSIDFSSASDICL